MPPARSAGACLFISQPFSELVPAMANIKSQIKRNRQALAHRERNKAARSALKTHLKRFRTAADAGDRDSAGTAYRTAARELDQAASKGIVHANFAANHKSRMSKRLGAL